MRRIAFALFFLILAVPAAYPNVQYTLTGTNSARGQQDQVTFQLPDSFTPAYSYPGGFFQVTPINLTVNGAAMAGEVVQFYSSAWGGGFAIFKASNTSNLLLDVSGQQLYSGAESAPALMSTNTPFSGVGKATLPEGFTVNAASVSNGYVPVIGLASGSVFAGVPQLVTVQVTDGDGNLVTNFSGTVTLSTTDTSVGPAAYTYTADDHGIHIFSVDFGSSGMQTITASIQNQGLARVNSLVQSANAEPMQFIPVTPCRVVDTRNAAGPAGGPELAGGSVRTFAVVGGICGVPSNARAFSLNVTAVPDGELGYLSIWPAGQNQPLASTLNSDGRVKANAAIVPAGTNGSVTVYASDPTNIVIDVNGYFIPAGTAPALAFYPAAPCRIADTRNASGTLGGPRISGGQTRSFPIQSSSCNIPATAQAYSLNFTAIPRGELGYLSAWPTGKNQPVASTLNSSTGAVTANAAIVPAGTNGDISVYASDDTDVAIDIDGYFAPPGAGGLSLYTLAPCRVVDTREGSGGQPFKGMIAPGIAGGSCGVPQSAQAYVLNATVVPPSELNYLTLWPNGTNQPWVSTLNAADGAVTSNMAIVPAGNEAIDAYSSDPTHLVLDISSYFAP